MCEFDKITILTKPQFHVILITSYFIKFTHHLHKKRKHQHRFCKSNTKETRGIYNNNKECIYGVNTLTKQLFLCITLKQTLH